MLVKDRGCVDFWIQFDEDFCEGGEICDKALLLWGSGAGGEEGPGVYVALNALSLSPLPLEIVLPPLESYKSLTAPKYPAQKFVKAANSR